MKVKKIIFSFLIIILILLAYYFYFISLNIKSVEIKGNSLAPYLVSGDYVDIDYSYGENNKKISRESLVTFYSKVEGKELIKFVKAVPGDNFHVDEVNRLLLINGEYMVNTDDKLYKLTKQNIKMLKLYEKDLDGKLSSDMYLVFGNFPNTMDSGKFGPILRKNILGKILL